MPYYFAYGSNMNPARVEARIGATRRVVPGVLHDHALRFDKASRVAGIAHANVAPTPGERVEGALFELLRPEQIQLMDPFEGYPHEYDRHRLAVVTPEGAIEAWIYIAAPGTTAGSLKPAREYLAHLLAGRPFHSPAYHARLAAVEAVTGLDEAALVSLGLSRHN
ncbi:gamma-glutamylcyclotransferase [Halomonas campisalis]|uniref:Gamma-glutamylcyclotransferase n=1 Tax=Billgrantia campisalis TaxID=74661 RepID=A0ABS9PBY1_9GAMM|nr:gamma-glutamylcyclotransferase family protein [Halomonas campisalis]MCG6659262.1 gamma-glutamylcyclotransferase [Halomonas campisalis]MDR5864261.1 gamma-glutamylcyclotransferase [Halomonas campisalis]